MSEPLSLRYRPKKLADVIGQDVVVRILSNSFKQNNWHHAYILEGNLGCGKTSVSRIMAAMENCEQGKTTTPCGQCKNCKEIFEGKSIDVREIDAASNRSIENIRALQEEIHLYPLHCRSKYVIIDEAHGLTGLAADAALKMIEEPPDFVRFILCTTEPESFKSTIPSRCISLNFKKVEWHVLQEYLGQIAQKENIKASQDALRIAARSSQGSVRNALQNLQTLSGYSGEEEITGEIARTALNEVDDLMVFDLVQQITNVNTPGAIGIIDKLLAQGSSANKIINKIGLHLRNLLVYIMGGENGEILGLNEEEINRYSHQIKKAKIELISYMLGLLAKIRRDIVYNVDLSYLLVDFIALSTIKVIKINRIEKENEKEEK